MWLGCHNTAFSVFTTDNSVVWLGYDSSLSFLLQCYCLVSHATGNCQLCVLLIRNNCLCLSQMAVTCVVIAAGASFVWSCHRWMTTVLASPPVLPATSLPEVAQFLVFSFQLSDVFLVLELFLHLVTATGCLSLVQHTIGCLETVISSPVLLPVPVCLCYRQLLAGYQNHRHHQLSACCMYPSFAI